jgi:hypothetical protein
MKKDFKSVKIYYDSFEDMETVRLYLMKKRGIVISKSKFIDFLIKRFKTSTIKVNSEI